MSLAALRDTIDLLVQQPVLWVPGIVCGTLAAALWFVIDRTGMFYASRLFIIFLLASAFVIAGMLAAIRKNEQTLYGILAGGMPYYFRLLLPTLVIVFWIIVAFMLLVLTLGLFSAAPDTGLLTFLILCIVVPTIMLTFFYDTAVVFEDRKVFESLKRSIEVVMANPGEVILFYAGCLIIVATIGFGLMVAWTAFLSDRLEPITHYNETQLQSFTPEQLSAMVGQDGVWVTAIIIFAGLAILVPLLYTYKACFYRRISGNTPVIEQVTGEYDSKGRWYRF